MSIDSIISALVGIAAAAGGFTMGRRSSSDSAIQIASETVDMLQAQIETLKQDKDSKDVEILDLRTRITVLENLVTQRAKVDEVYQEIRNARMIIDNIAVRVGA